MRRAVRHHPPAQHRAHHSAHLTARRAARAQEVPAEAHRAPDTVIQAIRKDHAVRSASARVVVARSMIVRHVRRAVAPR